jgi:hypothetical protein
VSPGFEGKQSIWEPARDGYFDFLLQQKSNGHRVENGIGHLWKIKHFAPMELDILLVGGY